MGADSEWPLWVGSARVAVVVQDPHVHDNAPARNGRGHIERTTGSHNGAVGGAGGTWTTTEGL